MSDARVHPDARGFDGAAEVYERARPTYPAEAVDWLADKLGVAPGRRVLDLAAGTGKLTRDLVARGAEVVAVEPAAGMRAQLEGALPTVRVLDGVAEAIPLPDAAVDAVTVAQAFHWFRIDKALRELHRVLRPRGALGLIWNTRDLSQPLQRAVADLLEPLRRGAPWWRGFDVAGALASSVLFGPVEEARFEQRQELDRDGFVGRFLSVSFVASAPPDVRARVEADLRALVAGMPEPIVLPYVTEAYVVARA